MAATRVHNVVTKKTQKSFCVFLLQFTYMQLSKESLTDLRSRFIKNYGQELSDKLNDEELNEIGNLLLTVLSESLKLKVQQEPLKSSTQQSA